MDELTLLGSVVGLTVTAFVAWLLAYFTGPTKTLQENFARLGTPAGKSKDEIIGTVGPPHSESATADGGELLQWIEGSYHMALLFGADGICVRAVHETRR